MGARNFVKLYAIKIIKGLWQHHCSAMFNLINTSLCDTQNYVSKLFAEIDIRRNLPMVEMPSPQFPQLLPDK